ncbi:MAG: OmpH family outer membrane protein [Paramuribaculum sp.]|nr:OmpH family outer membrane protein [Paramuribaculum sp.]
MIKKFLLAVMIAIPAFGFAQVKFGVVDTQPIIQDLPDMKEAQAQLEASNNKLQEEFKLLEEEFNKLYKEFQALGEDTPATIRERRQNDLQEKHQKIQQFQQTAEQDLQRQYEQLMAPIQQKIQNAITAVGQENGFTFIFEKGVPLYVGKDVVDATSLIRAKLGLK